MQIVCNGVALHEMSNHFLFRGGGDISACDKVFVVLVYPENRI